MSNVKNGDRVTWRNAGATAHGKVQAVSPKRTVKTIKGKQIVRNGSNDDPAVTVESDKGGVALHLQHELRKG